MAKIKNTMTVSLEEFGKKAGEYALDEFEYKGLTIRQWADKITSGESQPVKHGKWEQGKCTNCGKSLEDLFEGEFYYDCEEIHFCPNCGSKNRMGGDSE